MRVRRTIVGVGALLLVAAGGPGSLAPADAASGPPRLQRLAAAQTKLLFTGYHGVPGVFPRTCTSARHPHVVAHTLLLPTPLDDTDDATFHCVTRARSVLVDATGAIATEDDRGDTYTLADGTVLLFTRANLERICDDFLSTFPLQEVVVDGRARTPVAVSTRVFDVFVNAGAGQYYQDSVDVGHPGRLATAYCGDKALVHLRPGRHTISVDHSALGGGVYTYRVVVR